MTVVTVVTGADVWPAVTRLLNVGEDDAAVLLARLAVRCRLVDTAADAQAAKPVLLRLAPILRARDQQWKQVLDAIHADPTLC